RRAVCIAAAPELVGREVGETQQSVLVGVDCDRREGHEAIAVHVSQPAELKHSPDSHTHLKPLRHAAYRTIRGKERGVREPQALTAQHDAENSVVASIDPAEGTRLRSSIGGRGGGPGGTRRLDKAERVEGYRATRDRAGDLIQPVEAAALKVAVHGGDEVLGGLAWRVGARRYLARTVFAQREQTHLRLVRRIVERALFPH